MANLKRLLRLANQRLAGVTVTGTPPAAGPRSRTAGGMPMVRVPAGFHYQAVRNGNQLASRPGLNGSGMQPMARTPIGAYTQRIRGVNLNGGQAQGIVPASGGLTLTIGPQGLGTTWYPAQATISTTTGPLDTSTCKVYLGVQGVPATLVATIFPGGAGTAALAIPPMMPGQLLFFTWTNAHVGDTAGANVIGTMDALSTG